MSDGKRKSLDAGASGNEEDQRSTKKSKGVIEDLEGLQCPICLQLPKGDVYLCSNGHSVCNESMEKLVSCPTCRVPYQRGPARIRNHFAEDILSKVLFECPWKEEGCEEDRFSRQEVAKHESECLFNPAPIKLCRLLFSSSCAHEVVPTFFKNPNLGLPNELLEHVRNVHYKERNFGLQVFPGKHVILRLARFEMDKLLNDGTSIIRNKTITLLDNDQSRNTIGVFIIYRAVFTAGDDYKHSWFAVRLTDRPVSRTVSLKLTLEGTPSESIDGKDPNVQTLWNARIMGVQEFHQFNMKPREEREEMFSVRWSDIQQYYLNAEGNLRIRFVFTVKDDEAVEKEDSNSRSSDVSD